MNENSGGEEGTLRDALCAKRSVEEKAMTIENLTDATCILANEATFDEVLQDVKGMPLLDALTHLAIWENDRAVRQALRDERDPNTGALWDTCFRYIFKSLLAKQDAVIKDDERQSASLLKERSDDELPLSGLGERVGVLLEQSDSTTQVQEIIRRVKAISDDRDTWKRRVESSAFPGEVFITFKDLRIGEHFIAFPVHGSFREASHVFKKTAKGYEVDIEPPPARNASRLSDHAPSSMPNGAPVLRVVV